MKFKLNEDIFTEDTLAQRIDTPEYKKTVAQADRVLGTNVEERDAGQIEDILDRVLKINKREIARGGDNFVNVLFEGPAGTGKTARIKKWAQQRGINLVTVLASTMDDTDLGGAIAPDKETGKVVTRLATTEFDELGDVPNSVLFLDEFNRAPHSVRGTLLTLIQNHTIRDDRVPGKARLLKNFLFTVAAINPYDPRYNTEELDDAEKSRFKYIKTDYDNLGSKKWLIKELDKLIKSTDDPEDIMEFERKKDLVNNVLGSREFTFDSTEEIIANAVDSGNPEANGLITTPRTFTNLIMYCDGTKEDFLDNWNSFCNALKKNTVEEILANYQDKDDKANSVFNKDATPDETSSVFAQKKKSAYDKLMKNGVF